MKLSAPQIEKVCAETPLELVSETGNAAQELKKHFGAHTFFVDPNGLFILEPQEQTGRAQPVLVAEWAEGSSGGSRQLRLTDPRAVGPDLELATD